MDSTTLYITIKTIHVSCVATSIALLIGRASWQLIYGRRLWWWLRVMPHVIDTLLLASGLTLAFLIHQYPFVNSDWLSAKVYGLVMYIALGLMIFRGPDSRTVRALASLGALLVFGYIVSVAITRQPSGFLGAVI